MSRYQGRHSARHAAPQPSRSARAVTVLRRPVVSGSLALAVLGTGAVGAVLGDAHEADAASIRLSSQTFEQTDSADADGQRAAEDGDAAVDVDAPDPGTAPEIARAKAAELLAAREAAERKAADERASRAAQRKKLVASARSNPKAAARAMLGDFGFSHGQWSCLERLWAGESNWNYRAYNSSSSAGGIPQALPAAKMASAGSDWASNPATQIKWGLGYIKHIYGTPCNAWNTWQSRSPHWY